MEFNRERLNREMPRLFTLPMQWNGDGKLFYLPKKGKRPLPHLSANQDVSYVEAFEVIEDAPASMAQPGKMDPVGARWRFAPVPP